VNPAAQVSTGAEMEMAAEDLIETEAAVNSVETEAAGSLIETQAAAKKKTPRPTLQRDWSASLGSAGVAPDQYPAKWQFSPTGTPACSDYVVFGVNEAGASGSRPNIVGYMNLYVNSLGTGTCSGTAPTVLFSYFVGTGTVQTSPVLGLSSGQVAYVESSGASKFHVLTGAGVSGINGTIAGPVAPGASNGATDVSITLNGSVGVTRSSPFYAYAYDTAYVGDDSGKLHKFYPVFSGTPAEVTTGGWPVTVSAGNILTSPVYDSASTLVFVGDSTGYLHSVTTTGSPTVVTSPQLGTGAEALVEAPMVDSSTEKVYVFTAENATSTTHASVFQLPYNFTGSTSLTGLSVNVGASSTSVPLYAGTFDNIYFTSEGSHPTTPTGNLYVCGNVGGNPTLYQVAISSGALSTVTTGPVLASTNVGCSPLTEFLNTTTSVDWLFAGVSSTSCGGAIGAGTQGGCVMSFNITSAAPTIGPWTPSTSFVANSEIVDTAGNLQKCTSGCGVTGGTSGATTPAWAGSGTTNDNITNASAIGTVSSNGAASGNQIVIGGLMLTATATTAAAGAVTVDLSTISNGDTVTIAGTTYTFVTSLTGAPANAILIECSSSCHPTHAQNLYAAIIDSPTSCVTNPCFANVTKNANVSASYTAASSTVDLSAAQTGLYAGSGGDNLTMACGATSVTHHDFGFAGGTTVNSTGCTTTTAVAFTGGADGSSTAPSFQWTGASGVVTDAQLAANIAGAITSSEQTANGISLSYTGGATSLTITGAGANAGAAGNAVGVSSAVTGFAWTNGGTATSLLKGGTGLIWTYQSASVGGQTTAPQATGASGIIIDNVGAASGTVANIYFGTLAGTGTTNSGVEMTQSGLK